MNNVDWGAERSVQVSRPNAAAYRQQRFQRAVCYLCIGQRGQLHRHTGRMTREPVPERARPVLWHFRTWCPRVFRCAELSHQSQASSATFKALRDTRIVKLRRSRHISPEACVASAHSLPLTPTMMPFAREPICMSRSCVECCFLPAASHSLTSSGQVLRSQDDDRQVLPFVCCASPARRPRACRAKGALCLSARTSKQGAARWTALAHCGKGVQGGAVKAFELKEPPYALNALEPHMSEVRYGSLVSGGRASLRRPLPLCCMLSLPDSCALAAMRMVQSNTCAVANDRDFTLPLPAKRVCPPSMAAAGS